MSRKYKIRDQHALYFVSFATVYWIDLFVRQEEIWQVFQLGELDESRAITRRQFAVLLKKMVDPFHIKQIDHFGNYFD